MLRFLPLGAAWLSLAAFALCVNVKAATNLPAYYAHPTELDSYGVIAPWYHGLNGQLDERLH
ncbi:MAG TPA: hypothetical protein VJT54_08885, partial [Verrucomicrobiae bacterium]|nr:hypothetical protein [Verrucomicrobiae bacterium]